MIWFAASYPRLFSVGKSILVLLLFVYGVAVSGSSYGQQVAPVPIKIGEADLYPSVLLEYQTINNVYRADDDEAVDGTGFRVSPLVSYSAEKRGLKISLGYEGDYGSFSEDELNFDDHRLFGSVDAILTSKKRFSGAAFLLSTHQDFGTGLSRGVSNEGLDQVERTGFGLSSSFTYGAPTAKLNLAAGFSINNISYQNRLDITDGRGYLEASPFARLTYRISNDSRALLEARFRSISYDNSQLDKDESSVFTGLSFSGTGKSGGELRVGAATSRFSENPQRDDTILVADISLFFLPTSFSRVEFNLVRKFDDLGEFDQGGNERASIDDSASIVWQNRWSGFLSTMLSLDYQNKVRDCPELATNSLEAGLEVSIQAKRWMEIGVGGSNISQKADDCEGVEFVDSEFNSSKFTVFARVSL